MYYWKNGPKRREYDAADVDFAGRLRQQGLSKTATVDALRQQNDLTKKAAEDAYEAAGFDPTRKALGDVDYARSLIDAGASEAEILNALGSARHMTKKAAGDVLAIAKSKAPFAATKRTAVIAAEASLGYGPSSQAQIEQLRQQAKQRQRKINKDEGGISVLEYLAQFEEDAQGDVVEALRAHGFNDFAAEGVVPKMTAEAHLKSWGEDAEKAKRRSVRKAKRERLGTILAEYDVPLAEGLNVLKRLLAGRRRLPSLGKDPEKNRRRLFAVFAEDPDKDIRGLTADSTLSGRRARALRRYLWMERLFTYEQAIRDQRNKIGRVLQDVKQTLKGIADAPPLERRVVERGGRRVEQTRPKQEFKEPFSRKPWGSAEYGKFVKIVKYIAEEGESARKEIKRIFLRMTKDKHFRHAQQQHKLQQVVGTLQTLVDACKVWLSREGSKVVADYFRTSNSKEAPLLPHLMMQDALWRVLGVDDPALTPQARQQIIKAKSQSERKRALDKVLSEKKDAIHFRLKAFYTRSERDLLRSIAPLVALLHTAYSDLYAATSGNTCDIVLSDEEYSLWKTADAWTDYQLREIAAREADKMFQQQLDALVRDKRLIADAARGRGSSSAVAAKIERVDAKIARIEAHRADLREFELTQVGPRENVQAIQWRDQLVDGLREISDMPPLEHQEMLEACEGQPVYVVVYRGGVREVLKAILPAERRRGAGGGRLRQGTLYRGSEGRKRAPVYHLAPGEAETLAEVQERAVALTELAKLRGGDKQYGKGYDGVSLPQAAKALGVKVEVIPAQEQGSDFAKEIIKSTRERAKKARRARAGGRSAPATYEERQKLSAGYQAFESKALEQARKDLKRAQDLEIADEVQAAEERVAELARQLEELNEDPSRTAMPKEIVSAKLPRPTLPGQRGLDVYEQRELRQKILHPPKRKFRANVQPIREDLDLALLRLAWSA